ncbi:MAG TPA: VWA domain-containing protein [Blastocatellia bacterium]|nr:VWA domain-containing protein [Blastocatellia bacterium]
MNLDKLLICFLVLTLFATSTNLLSQTSEQSIIDPSTVVVSVGVNTLSGGFISGLKRDNFRLYSDNIPQSITYFNAQESPASILFLVDLSSSMEPKSLGQVNKGPLVVDAIDHYLKTNHIKNEYSIISFSQNIQTSLEWTDDPIAVVSKMRELLALKKSGLTNLYDACLQGLEMVQSRPYSNKALVVLSDGLNYLGNNKDPNKNEDKLKEAIRRSGILIYCINPNCIKYSLLERVNQACDVSAESSFVKEIVPKSGGWALLATRRENLDTGISIILNHINKRYQLGFKPSFSQNSNHAHKVKVTLALSPDLSKKFKNLIIKHREGYYLP